jgi:hypothetical protein
MVFAIIIIALVGVIAFFHYTQGFWSATLSAIVAVFAAALAVGYHENVVNTLLKGKMADQANAIALVAIFGLTYIILRVIFDKAIPGNLRLPVIIDKIGAGVMGFIAAIFSVGVVAVAAQTLPYGVTVGGYSRYPLAEDRTASIHIQGKQQYQEIPVSDQLEADTLAPEDRKSLWIPVDDWVMGLVSHLSDGGSLAGARPLTSVHPNYLDEVYAQRLGIQTGGARVATNAVKEQVSIKGLFRSGPLPQLDAEIPASRVSGKPVKAPDPKTGESLLVVRVQFDPGTGDVEKSQRFVRFSMGSIRLVVPSQDEGTKSIYPVGTVEAGTTLLTNRMDDFIFTNEGSAADVAFVVRNDEVFANGGKPVEGKPLKIADGVFIEVKRLVREELGGKDVKEGITPDKSVAVIRKLAITDALKKGAVTPPGGAAAQPAEGAATPPGVAAGASSTEGAAPAPPAEAGGARTPPKRNPRAAGAK